MSFKAWAQTKIPVAHRVIKTVHESKTMRIRNIYNLQPGDRIHRLSTCSHTGLRFGIFDRYDGDRTYAFFGDTPDTRSTVASNDQTRNIRLGWPGYDDDELTAELNELLGLSPVPNPNPLGELLPNGFRVGEQVYYMSIMSNPPTRHEGYVVHNQHLPNITANSAVWANWIDGNQLGWMPTENVHRV